MLRRYTSVARYTQWDLRARGLKVALPAYPPVWLRGTWCADKGNKAVVWEVAAVVWEPGERGRWVQTVRGACLSRAWTRRGVGGVGPLAAWSGAGRAL